MNTRIWQHWQAGIVHALTIFGIGLAGVSAGGEDWPAIG